MPIALSALLADLKAIMPARSIGLRTGISTVRIEQYLSGEVSPYSSTVRKLATYYRSVQYFRLRSGGLSPRQSRLWWGARNNQVEYIIDRLNSIAEDIAASKGKAGRLDVINGIKEGFSASDESADQLFEDYPQGYKIK